MICPTNESTHTYLTNRHAVQSGRDSVSCLQLVPAAMHEIRWQTLKGRRKLSPRLIEVLQIRISSETNFEFNPTVFILLAAAVFVHTHSTRGMCVLKLLTFSSPPDVGRRRSCLADSLVTAASWMPSPPLSGLPHNGSRCRHYQRVSPIACQITLLLFRWLLRCDLDYTRVLLCHYCWSAKLPSCIISYLSTFLT